jgi:hypothetical protein
MTAAFVTTYSPSVDVLGGDDLVEQGPQDPYARSQQDGVRGI